MTLDHESITEKKAKLQQAIRVLEKLRGFSLDKVEKDEIVFGSIQHYLMIGIEAILDIGSHILTEDFSASPATYEDVIILLGKNNVIPESLMKASTGIGKFRNKMIHEYADVDMKKVYTYLQVAPKQLTEFDQAFGRYLLNKN